MYIGTLKIHESNKKRDFILFHKTKLKSKLVFKVSTSWKPLAMP